MALNKISGFYTGKLHFYNPRHLDKRDSLSMKWDISAYGVFSTQELPVAFLANFAPAGTEVRTALDHAEPIKYSATIDPQQKSSLENTSLLLCSFLPDNYTLTFATEYEGKNYNVSVVLLRSMTRTEGSGASNYAAISEHKETSNKEGGTTKAMNGYLLLDKMTVNGEEYTINDYAVIRGKN